MTLRTMLMLRVDLAIVETEKLLLLIKPENMPGKDRYETNAELAQCIESNANEAMDVLKTLRARINSIE